MDYLFLILAIVLLIAWYIRKRSSDPVVVDIVIYPIKSCGELRLNSIAINSTGMIFDREWVLLTPDNKIVTQKEDLSLMKLKPDLVFEGEEIKSVELRFDDKKFKFCPEKTGEIVKFDCKSAMCEGVEEGKAVNGFLRNAFGKEYRLVRVIKHRQLNQHPKYQGIISDEYKTNFVNTAQFLVVAYESFEFTKNNLPKDKRDALDILALRGNIIVKGLRPFEEDTWSRFKIGNVEFQGIGRCSRCIISTVDIKNLKYDEDFEPVTTLRKLNGNGTKGYLGMHCVRLSDGEIQVGQRVLVKETKNFPYI